MPRKTLVANPTLRDFPIYYHWDSIRNVLGARRFRQFEKFMQGQTTSDYGVPADDLRRFLKGLPVID